MAMAIMAQVSKLAEETAFCRRAATAPCQCIATWLLFQWNLDLDLDPCLCYHFALSLVHPIETPVQCW